MSYPIVHLEEALSLCDSGEWGSDPTSDDTIPVIRVADIKKDYSISYATAPPREIPIKKRDSKTVQNGDILVVKSSGSATNVISGRAAIVEGMEGGTCGFSNFLLRLRPDEEKCEPYFLFYLLNSEIVRKQVLQLVASTTYPNIKVPSYKKIQIPLPPLKEQHRIVDLLKRADSIRRLRKQAQDTASQLIPALFIEMFGDPATNPKGWPIRKVSDFVERFEGGKNLKAGSDRPDSCRILKVSAVTSGKYIEDECKPMPDDYSPPEKHYVRQGDLLFSRANTEALVGATALVDRTNGKTLLPDKLWRFVWAEEIEPAYIHALFQSHHVRQELSKMSSGTSASMRNISQGKLRELKLPLAPYGEQKLFNERVCQTQGMLGQQAAAIDNSESTFQSLLHRAFNGGL